MRSVRLPILALSCAALLIACGDDDPPASSGPGSDSGTTDVSDSGVDTFDVGVDTATDTEPDTTVDTDPDSTTDVDPDVDPDVPVCDDQCADGEVQCTDDTLETCVADGDGCLDWDDGTDCAADGQICIEDMCADPTCDDGRMDGDETDIDCGGSCPACPDDAGCATGEDCESGVCDEGVCAAATCEDGVLNGDETDVDCGGSCGPCEDGDACGDGDDCGEGSICLDDTCVPEHCDDAELSGDETDVDCGGSCGACEDGDACLDGIDCSSETCLDETCIPAHCVNGEADEDETDVDCGGSCPACDDGAGCADETDCTSGVCADDVCAEAACDDAVQNGDETGLDCGGSCDPCDDGGGCGGPEDCVSGVCTDGLCAAAECGDGVTNGDEECDDGNDDDTDECTNACTIALCGDGVTGLDEECDDGNDVDEDECTNACTDAVCGDSIVGPGEECDDGNDVDTDACTNACTDAVCGDSIVGPGEECDDGNDVDTDACTNACTDAVCGDSIVGPGEECDDGNAIDIDGCLSTCVSATCGNGSVDVGESCDDGNRISGDGCSALCGHEYFCRNNSILISIDNPATLPELNGYFDTIGVAYDYAPQTDGEIMSDLALLSTYDTVIYYKRDRVSTDAELTAMESYVQNGGFLITTGRDSIGGPTDPGFAGFIRSATDGDGPFGTDASVTDDTVPATNGPYGTFPIGTPISITLIDHDQASPIDAGTISVADVEGRSKLLYTPGLGAGGVLYYWNGNGTRSDSYFGDWTTPGVAQDMFMNMMAESCRGRATYVGADWWEREAGFDRMLTNAVTGFAPHGETINVAAWTAGADESREVPNTDAALTEGATALGRTVSIEPFSTTDVPSLEAALADAEVLLFYENEGADQAATLAAWAPTLAEFAAEGGNVVFLGWATQNIAYLDASGLMPGVTLVDGGGTPEAVTLVLPDHPLLSGVSESTTPDATGSVAVSGDVVSVADAYSGSVLAYRIIQ